MALTVKQRRWILGVALALTLTAVALMEGKDESGVAVVQADSAKTRHTQQKTGAEVDQVGNVTMAKLTRQRLPENEKDMFAGKSWFVAPPVPKAQQPSAPQMPFVYMGKLAEAGEKVVILLTKQNRSYEVREGDVLDNIYRVDEVRPPVMTLTYLPLNIKQIIQIGVLN
jgi:hypothetical protein